ncbi:MAG: S8 family serine peptidase [Myxococcales bacterium]|nr:S8 family serine peptidase [Myxococcales bacterium]
MPSYRQREFISPEFVLLPAGPARAIELRPATGGAVIVRAVVGADNCKVTAALHDPHGVAVTAPYVGNLNQLALTWQIPDDHAGLGQTWSVRVVNTGAARGVAALEIAYPAAFEREIAPLPKLNDMAVMALREIGLTAAVVDGHFDVGCDRQFVGYIPEGWAHHVNVVRGITITRGRIDKRAIQFVPPADDLPRGGIELVLGCDDVRLKKGISLGGIDDARLTIRAGLAVVRGALAITPVAVTLTGDLKGLANLLALVDAKDRLATALRAALVEQLAGPRAGVLATATTWLRRLVRMDELLDVQVTAAGLVLDYTTVRGAPPPLSTAPAPTPSGRLQHLIVVMMENRSYDHMLAALFAAHPALGTMPNYQATHGPTTYPFTAATTSQVIVDPPHGPAAQTANAAGDWLGPYAPRQPPNLGDVLTYQPVANIPTLAHLVEHGCVCRAWRAAVPGSTWPNRNYALSGTSGGALDNAEGGFDLFDFLTVCDVLQAQGARWRYYRSDVTFLELYRRWALDQTRIVPVDEFHRGAAQGQLPAVSWIEPNIADFGASHASDDHPPADVKFGQGFLADVYNSLVKFTATGHTDWLLVVTYDEHGGFYDSAGADPSAVADGPAGPGRRGFRVPALFVSPWLAPGVCDVALDHASIVRTVLDRFCAPEPLLAQVPRVHEAVSLARLLDGVPGAGWPVPRTAPVPPPPLAALGPSFYPPPPPPLMGGAAAPTGPAFTRAPADTALWRQVQDRQRAMNDAVVARTMGGPAPIDPLATAPAALEAIHVGLGRHDPATLAPGWTAIAGLAGDDTALLLPPAGVTVTEAWDRIHALRGAAGLTFAEPLWATRGGHGPEEGPADGDADWALRAIRAPEAWRRVGPTGRTRGAGVVVAHLDTGLTPHRDLDGAVLAGLGWDYVDEDATPEDRLEHGLGLFPGHGTSTASVLVSRERDQGHIVGVAPEASILPYRISRSVVHLSMVGMVKAIKRAVASGAHVISLSAGGLWSYALHAAVRDATRAGVIVVAAAGNRVRVVVWPARFPEVIGVGACDRELRRWSGSSRGDAVAVTAPGVGVWCAAAGPGDGVRAGTGTSFATAMVAGAVANWLSYWGRDSLIARFGVTGLAAAARRAVRRAVRSLSGPADGMGTGVLDLERLLGEPLEEIDLGTLMGGGRKRMPLETAEAVAAVTVDDPDALARFAPADRAVVADEVAFFAWLAEQGPTPTAWDQLARADGSALLRARL